MSTPKRAALIMQALYAMPEPIGGHRAVKSWVIYRKKLKRSPLTGEWIMESAIRRYLLHLNRDGSFSAYRVFAHPKRTTLPRAFAALLSIVTFGD